MEFDVDGNPVVKRKRDIEPLPAVDHSKMDYAPFNKDFYEEHEAVRAMTVEEVEAARRRLDLQVSGADPSAVPKPAEAFAYMGFDHILTAALKKAGMEKPSPIQAAAIPGGRSAAAGARAGCLDLRAFTLCPCLAAVALSGFDVIGIAKTGSGKTLAYVLPMCVHVMDQPELARGEGPVALIVCPTRELAQQVHREASRFAGAYGMACVAGLGGMDKKEQIMALKHGAEVLVGTPGRIIDLAGPRDRACTLRRVTYLVLDEADRMLDLGFEPQVRSICDAVRPDRQTLLFSATMPRHVERLAAAVTSDPVRVAVGPEGAANRDVRQEAVVFASEGSKQAWLDYNLQAIVDQGDVIVFVSRVAAVDEMVARLKERGFRAAALHGDMHMAERMRAVRGLRDGDVHVLVATDVAARGLDIRTVRTVINYDPAKDPDTHVHRVGRTGRMGDREGVAYTLLTSEQPREAAHVFASIIAAGQAAPQALRELAYRDRSYRKDRTRAKGTRGGKTVTLRTTRARIGSADLVVGPQTTEQAIAMMPGQLPPPPPMPPGGQPGGQPAASSLPPPPPVPASVPATPPAPAAAPAPALAPAPAPTPRPVQQPTRPTFLNQNPLLKHVAGVMPRPPAAAPPQPRPTAPAASPAAERQGPATTAQAREELAGMLRARDSGRGAMRGFRAASTGAVQPDAPLVEVVAPKRTSGRDPHARDAYHVGGGADMQVRDGAILGSCNHGGFVADITTLHSLSCKVLPCHRHASQMPHHLGSHSEAAVVVEPPRRKASRFGAPEAATLPGPPQPPGAAQAGAAQPSGPAGGTDPAARARELARLFAMQYGGAGSGGGGGGQEPGHWPVGGSKGET